MTLRVLDLFSGIGGFSLAARWLGGFETVQFVERDPYCQRILRKHWPTVPIHDDITTFNPEPGSADVVVGGFPCQDISQAGKGAGLAGERSGLFYELLRVVCVVRPRYVVLENVAAILGRGLDEVLGALAEAGYDAEWACIPAAAVGACHQRDRWWCVAYPSGKRSPDWIRTGIGPMEKEGGPRVEHESQRCGAGVAYPNNSGMEAAKAEQLTAGTEQRGELAAADAISLRGQRWGASADMAGATGAGEAVSKGREGQWQRDGDAAHDRSATAPHPHHQRQQEQHPAAVAGGAGWPRWGDAPQRLNPDWRAYVSEPCLRRGDDGLSNRVDRLKALGNAVVPQVAMIPLARVLELAS
jgi:DNA (cytosine-5)-methyltransferase 1